MKTLSTSGSRPSLYQKVVPHDRHAYGQTFYLQPKRKWLPKRTWEPKS